MANFARNFAQKAEKDIADIFKSYATVSSELAKKMVGALRVAQEDLAKIKGNVTGLMNNSADQTSQMRKAYPTTADTGPIIAAPTSRAPSIPGTAPLPTATAPGASPGATSRGGHGGGGGG